MSTVDVGEIIFDDPCCPTAKQAEQWAEERADDAANLADLRRAIDRSLSVLTPSEERLVRNSFGLVPSAELEDVVPSRDLLYALRKLRRLGTPPLLAWIA